MAFTPGFISAEAEALLGVLAQLEGTTPPPFQAPPLPPNWKLLFDSPQIGIFDNKWQLWQTDVSGQYAILIRGTVDEAGSIIDDLLSVMIPASGSVTVDSLTLSYQLAADPAAAVHLGFTLALFILLFDPTDGILVNLPANTGTQADIFVAGHSQGAAIATLLRSFLNYSDILQKVFGRQYNYKTYVFAQPKPGNDHYGYDFETIVTPSEMGFTVNNTQDWVPQVPLTFELLGDINTPNPLSVLGAEDATLATALSAVENLRSNIATAQLSKHQPQMSLLGQILPKQTLQPTTSASTGQGITILPTLNFVGAGLPIILQGVPGTNPCDPKDFFWQHHTAMYYDLLAGIPIPTQCHE
jgi:hypothetical protein